MTSALPGCQAIDILSYNHYIGILFANLKQYRRAVECFSQVLTQPTDIVHPVHLESYKKVMLLELIDSGKNFEFPQRMNKVLKKQLKEEGEGDIWDEQARSPQSAYTKQSELLVYREIVSLTTRSAISENEAKELESRIAGKVD